MVKSEKLIIICIDENNINRLDNLFGILTLLIYTY